MHYHSGHIMSMATPILTKSVVPGALGDLLIDVRSTEREAPGPAVIIVHGFKGFKDWGSFPFFAERLARAGFSAVSVNLSGSGYDDNGDFAWPDRFGHNSFSAEQYDIDRVLEALDRGGLSLAPPTQVALLGHSRGGGAAILAAARLERISALVTWAAIASVRRWSPADMARWRERGQIDVLNTRTGVTSPIFLEALEDIEANAGGSLDIEAAAARVTVPWLLVHGDADPTVPIEEADRLARAAEGRSTVERFNVQGANHTFGAVHPYLGAPAALELVFDRTVRFLSRVF